MSRIIIISFLLLTHHQSSFAQDTTRHKYDVQKRQLKTRLTFLEKYNYWNNQDFDIQQYSDRTAVLLISFLRLRPLDNIDLDGFKNLNLSAKTNDSLQVQIYNFGYNCGGTRGWITHPIILWRDRDGLLHAYNFSKKINCHFFEIHKLNTSSGSLFLLLGMESGNSSTVQNIAYVIKIDDKNIYTNYKAFVNRSYVNLPNTELSFDAKSQTLKCSSEMENDNFLLHLKYIKPTNDTTATNKLLQLFSRDYNEPVCLKFIREKFSRQTKCR